MVIANSARRRRRPRSIPSLKNDPATTSQRETITMDIDEALTNIVGEYGRAQRQFFWVLVWATIISTMQTLHMVFIGAEPKDFFCAHGLKQSPGCPKEGDTCAQYLFPNSEFTSIVSEWSLVCDQSYKVGVAQTVFMVGVMVGSFIFASMADRHGRRSCLYGTLGALLWATLAGAYSPTYYIYLVARFAAGVITGGWNLVSFIMATELIGPSVRGFCGVAFPAAFAIGICVYSGMAYFIRDWRMLSLACAVPCLIGFYFYWSFPESPRWLLTHGKVKEANKILEAIATANHGKPPVVPVSLKVPSVSPGATKSQSSMKVLLIHPVLRSRTIINSITAFASSAVYYGMTLSAGNLGNNRYISVSLSGFIELPAYIIALIIIDRLGRRWTFATSFIITSFACFAILLSPSVLGPGIEVGPVSLTVALGLFGKMAVSIAASVVFLYSAELYPTTCRNMGIAVVTMVARLGGAAAPLLLPLNQIYPSLDYGVYGALSLLSGLLAFFLPETAGKPLPETVDDLVEHRTMSRKAGLLPKR